MQANTQMTSVLEISVQHQQLLAICKNQKVFKNQLLGGSAKLETADIHHPKEILTYIDDKCQAFMLFIFKHRFEVFVLNIDLKIKD